MAHVWELGVGECSHGALIEKDGLLCLLLQIMWIILNTYFTSEHLELRYTLNRRLQEKTLGPDFLMGFPQLEHCRYTVVFSLLREESTVCDPSWEGDNRRKPTQGFL